MRIFKNEGSENTEIHTESWQILQWYAKISPQFWNIGSEQGELLRVVLSDHRHHWWFILTQKYLEPIPQKDFQNRLNQVPVFIERTCFVIKKHPVFSKFSKIFDFSLIFQYQMKALTERSHLTLFYMGRGKNYPQPLNRP